MRRVFWKLAALTLAATVLATGPAGAGPGAGPHLSGDEYVALRPDTPVPVVKFILDIETPDGKEKWDVSLGPDYVIRHTENNSTVFDFRHQRLLTIEKSEKNFENISLYGYLLARFFRVYNNLAVFGQMRQSAKGELQTPGLQRFLIEHMSGLQVPEAEFARQFPKVDLQSEQSDGKTVGRVEGAQIFIAEYGEPGFPSEDHRKTFAAWLALGVRMHPQAALALASESRMPMYVQLAEPAGALISSSAEMLQRRFEFRNVTVSTGRVDLLANLESANPSWPPFISEDLATVMVNAARGTASGGPTSDAHYVTQIENLLEEGHIFDALLMTLHATQQYENCQTPDMNSLSPELCSLMARVVSQIGSDEQSQRYVQAVKAAGARDHLNAAQILILLRDSIIRRPDILEMFIAQEVIKAKKANQSTWLMDKEFKELPKSFLRAFKADPYNPKRYAILFEYLETVAQSNEEKLIFDMKARVVLDLARVLPDRRIPSTVLSSVNFEKEIDGMFPVLMPFPESTR